MKKYALVGAAACLLSLGLVGCSNTADGAKQDAAQDGQKVAQATDQAVDATKNAANQAAVATKNAADSAGQAVASTAQDAAQAAKNAAHDTKVAADSAGQAVASAAKDGGKTMVAATEVTPKVKLAIVADKDLNNTSNLINVDTKDGVVHLTGHVINSADKKKASEVAQKALKDLNATDKLSNELTVSAQ